MRSGNLGKSAPSKDQTFICNESDGLEAYEFADDVKERVKNIGITTPPRPLVEEEHATIIQGLEVGSYFDGRMPTIIRTLTLDQLSSLYGLLRAYYAYLAFQTKLIAAERSEALRQKEFIWSSVRGQYKRAKDPLTGKRPSDQAASDSTRYDVRFVEYNAKYQKINALYDILDAMLSVAESDMKLVSRQVTIQQEKFRQKLLQDGFGRRGDYEEDIGGSDYGQTPAETTARTAAPGQRTARVSSRDEVQSRPAARRPAIGRPGPGRR